jgi:hypothetical protein
VIHLVSHPLASIEALSRLSRVDLDELLPQPFAAANQTALHHAMVHWVAVNSLLEMFADTRVRIEDLGGDDMPGIASLLLKISAAERQRISTSQPHPSLTWKDLRDEDSDLAALVCRTGVRYGYDREVRKSTALLAWFGWHACAHMCVGCCFASFVASRTSERKGGGFLPSFPAVMRASCRPARESQAPDQEPGMDMRLCTVCYC